MEREQEKVQIVIQEGRECKEAKGEATEKGGENGIIGEVEGRRRKD